MIDRKQPSFDLEERTFEFAKNVRLILKLLSPTIANQEDSRQLVRSSGSAGANYIESVESLSQKDKLMRLKIVRKESKESFYWFRLIKESNDFEEDLWNDWNYLMDEADQLKKIFSKMILKLEENPK
ncbi:MAG: four helix bundle protein [Saprospiraceae bacterium]|nr:four helix bundle protein [Saprospiraceae bacterium]MCB9326037.1 four helix bundle protein [Lewinellaceae bacterium]